MAEVSITLAEVSMIFGRTVMADVSLGRSVNGLIHQLADQSDYLVDRRFGKMTIRPCAVDTSAMTVRPKIIDTSANVIDTSAIVREIIYKCYLNFIIYFYVKFIRNNNQGQIISGFPHGKVTWEMV